LTYPASIPLSTRTLLQASTIIAAIRVLQTIEEQTL
jgi:hypothetical protein